MIAEILGRFQDAVTTENATQIGCDIRNNMDSLTGKLLIASPDMDDPNFGRSVVFLLQHSPQGASGVILNQPLPTAVCEVWDEISDDECECEHPINCGGPVEGPLLALHQKIDVAEEEIIPGIHMSIHREALNTIVMQSDFPFKIFSGYSGWGAEQLEQEIENGGWLIFDATPKLVFAEPDSLWKTVCEHVGHDVLKPHLRKVRNVDATLN